ncbi:CD1375 family protein [Clostridium taeniosporum]|nr:CD1375 family protein [Clostridium taeniosporum]
MIYKYMIKAYSILVRGGRMVLEVDKDNRLPVVPDDYKILVAEELANVSQ